MSAHTMTKKRDEQMFSDQLANMFEWQEGQIDLLIDVLRNKTLTNDEVEKDKEIYSLIDMFHRVQRLSTEVYNDSMRLLDDMNTGDMESSDDYINQSMSDFATHQHKAMVLSQLINNATIRLLKEHPEEAVDFILGNLLQVRKTITEDSLNNPFDQ